MWGCRIGLFNLSELRGTQLHLHSLEELELRRWVILEMYVY
jgi:hypothetical protein